MIGRIMKYVSLIMITLGAIIFTSNTLSFNEHTVIWLILGIAMVALIVCWFGTVDESVEDYINKTIRSRMNDLEQSLYDKVEEISKEIGVVKESVHEEISNGEDRLTDIQFEVANSVYDTRKKKDVEELSMKEFKAGLKGLKGKYVGIRDNGSSVTIPNIYKVVDVLENGEYIQFDNDKTYSVADFQRMFVGISHKKGE